MDNVEVVRRLVAAAGDLEAALAYLDPAVDVSDGKVTRWQDFGSKEEALDAAARPG